jgi:hypothetical protein
VENLSTTTQSKQHKDHAVKDVQYYNVQVLFPLSRLASGHFPSCTCDLARRRKNISFYTQIKHELFYTQYI